MNPALDLNPQSLFRDSWDRRASVDPAEKKWNGWRLMPFGRRHAASIVRWVKGEQQLRWLAPSTTPPLTAEKIVGWEKPGGQAFVLQKGHGGQPLGYGEVNPMRRGSDRLWLGHVVVRPDQRGRGVGSVLLQALLSEAFDRRDATHVALIVFPDNVAALRCYQRAGFRLMGEEFHQFKGQGSLHRLLRLEMTRPATLCSP